MRIKAVLSLAVLLVAMLVAPAAADEHEANVYVVHGVPDLTVDVWVDGDPTLEGFEPGSVEGPLTLPEGSYDVEIYGAGEDPDEADPAIAGTAEVGAGDNVSLVAHLDADGTPTLTPFANDTAETDDGEGRLTARHVAAAPATDIRGDGEPVFEGVENGDEGVADLPAGTVSADVTLAGEDDAVIGPADVDIAESVNTIVYAWGSAEDDSLDLAVQTIDAGHTPDEVPAGEAGLLEQSALSAWAVAAMAAAAAVALGTGVQLARSRR